MVDPRRLMRGQKVYYDCAYDYSFWAPLNWTEYQMTDQEGVIFVPEEDPRTGFHVQAKDLGDELEASIEEADLPALREGILEGMRALPDCEIEYEREVAKKDAVGFEFMLTFSLDGERCKRRMHLLFRGRRQYTIYGQAVPAEDYDVFHNILGYMYTSFTFGDLRKELAGIPDRAGGLGDAGCHGGRCRRRRDLGDPRARLKGLKTHYDEKWNYSFWAPLNWTQYNMVDQEGVIYVPEDDPRTCFFVSTRELGEELEGPITGEDLPALHEGIVAGLEAMPECEILEEKEIANDRAIGFEFTMTFSLDGAPCKRKMRLLYKGTHQFTIYGQAVPPEDFDVFYDVFEYMYISFAFGDLRLQLPQFPGSQPGPF